jgi:2-haloacid dehalogenase
MNALLELKPYPTSVAALKALRDHGLRLAYLSNLTPTLLAGLSRAAGISDLFEHSLSTDRVRAYKPDPRAYQMAEKAFGLWREEILFSAFGGWDAAGARSFGMPTFWVNPTGVPTENLGVVPNATGSALTDLVTYAVGWAAGDCCQRRTLTVGAAFTISTPRCQGFPA